MTFYRKHRFQTLEDMIGQPAVKFTLQAAISAGTLSHAYLLVGPRGTGKTSTARILAKIVNCENQEENSGTSSPTQTISGLPCNKCASCIAITEGSNMDVVEMDAASNRGIDDIRNLRENIKLSPTSARKKVYIIDEVHMLSGDAFNALLKTLEEPPSHVMFILATTEAQKVPATILSRVQRLDFKSAKTEELIAALERVALAEGIEVEPGAMASIAKHAQGSFRDGIKLLDQLAGFGKINEKVVMENLGLKGEDSVYVILEGIAKKDIATALKQVVNLIEAGDNAKDLIMAMLDNLQQLLLLKNGLGEQLVKEKAAEHFIALESLAKKFTLPQLVRTIDYIQKSLEQGRYTSIPSLPLELAIVECCIENTEFEPVEKVSGERLTEMAGVKECKEEEKPADIKISESKGIKVEDSVEMDQPLAPNPSVDMQKITERWAYVLETVRQYNYSLEALLRSSEVASCEEDVVVIEVPYTFHQRILEAPKSRDLLESILADILGRAIKVSTLLRPKPTKKEDVANIEVAADDEIISIAAEIFNSETIN